MTLTELLVVFVLFAALLVAGAIALFPALKAWSSQMDRVQIQRSAQAGLEKALRQLRLANQFQNDARQAIRFRVLEGGVQRFYIIYLYSPNDPIFNNAFTATSYQLRQVSIASLGAVFPNPPSQYGTGTLLMQEVKSPSAALPTTRISVLAGNLVANMDLFLIVNPEAI